MRPWSLRTLRHWLYCGPLLALCSCLVPIAGAQAADTTVLQDFVLRNWDVDDGLPSARINAVVRTADGYLWLATQKGVVQFDGTHFVVFDTSNTPGMKDDRASCLLLDRQGDLWVGTYGGTLLKREGQSFRAPDWAGALPPRKVSCLAQDNQGALWLALEDTGLLRFQNHHAELFTHTNGLASPNVRIVLCDDDRRLWAVAEGELRLFQEGRWQVPTGWSPAAQSVRSISPARDGGLWIATTLGLAGSQDARVYKLKDGQASAPLEPYPWPADSQQFERHALLEDQSGQFWCATTGGVFSRTPAGSWQRLLSVAPWVQVEVLCLAEDENGLIWMGTRTTGLLQVQKRQVMTLPLPASASGHAVLSTCASRDGSVWCGTDGAGVFRWQADQLSHFGPEQGLTSLHVAALLEDRHTNLWAATVGGLFHRVGERFELVPGPAALRQPLLALLEDQQGNLWTGGRPGLVRLTSQGAEVFGREAGLTGTAIRALAQDRKGRLWVGLTDAGLYWFDGQRFESCPVPQEARLRGICALHCDALGALWIGTDQAGLLRFHAGRFHQWLSSPDGLSNSHLSAILEDANRRLWIGSENGIFGCSQQALNQFQRGNTLRLQPRRLTPAEGLAHKVCSGVGQPAACQSADGRLWFPNGPAVAVFDPATLSHTVRVWPPVLEGASVDGLPTPLVAGRLQVRSGARRLVFHYASPNVLAPEQLRFRYRLDGLDKEWIEGGTRRDAAYYHLAPGAYEFQVLVSGPAAAWQAAPQGLGVDILPRVWERRPVQFAAGLALLGAVAAAAWTVERGQSRRRLARLEFQRTLDAERHRIARDIHDDLGSGLTEIILLSDSLGETGQPTPADQEVAGEISARARSLTRAMDEVVWALNPRNDTLEGFLTYFGKFAQEYLSRANLRCRWHVPVEVPDLPLSADLRHNLYLASKEALHNIVKHAGASEVSIRLDFTPEGFTLTIEDNGKGFPVDQPPARGNGLANMRQRLKELRGRCHIEAAPGRGTRVLFSFPAAINQPRPR
jgi:ligand-binding sensor domain-containing protein/signal transduction histidine kinase